MAPKRLRKDWGRRWVSKRAPGSSYPAPSDFVFLSHKQNPKAKKRAPELCVCAPVCWVLCVPFNTVSFRKAKSDPCQPGSESLLGSIFWSEGAIFFPLMLTWELGRESTLAQPPLLNYAGSLLQSPPAPGTTSLPVRSWFLSTWWFLNCWGQGDDRPKGVEFTCPLHASSIGIATLPCLLVSV